ncbi:YMGG-like glycine zipper-containing protein [Dyadobacter sp. CY343]|uniref:YMGG-like glycine zipper-containing protein n=1 Tax=Dyadobacter sp. CY343 TaxID=2907299 RepID=UPI001F2C9B68|nr:YMGG-like glycine zipper-containing protein [Dyadobacter sp. CY343]MCE7060651.1 YMGG-like glycine zipper-containing protein [Dyadobacter sp. CY343]
MKLPVSMLLAACVFTACDNSSKKHEAALKAQQATIDSMKVAMEKKAIVDSMNTVMARREIEETREEKQATQTVYASEATPAKKKSKWNHKAKGAVVGAGTGAVTGAIINKNRAEGALVGSLIGAGVGVGTGAIVDQQVKKKQKQQ